MAAVDLDDLLIRLKWQEEGANLPVGARAKLQSLVQAQQALTQTTGAGIAQTQAMTQATGAAAARTEDLGVKVQRAGVHVGGTGRSLGLLRTGLSMYAFQAVGATGVTGRLAQGLLMFGAGGIVTLGVVAGMALIAGAFRLITAEARAAEERIDAARKRLKELQEERDPTLGTSREIEAARTQLAAAQARLTTENDRLNRLAQERVALAGQSGVTVTLERARQLLLREGAVPDLGRAIKEVATLGGNIDELTGKLKRLQEEARKAERELVAALRAGELGRARGLELAPTRALTSGAFRPPAFGGAPGPMFPGFNAGPAVGTFAFSAQAGQAAVQQQHYGQALDFTRGVLVRTMTPQQLFNEGLVQLQLALDLGAITTEQFDAAVTQLTADMGKAQKRSAVLGVAIISAVSGAIAAVLQGGSATSVIGGILGTVGGIVGIGNPLLGAGIAGLGTVISSAGNRGVTIDRYSDAALQQLRGIPSGPERVELSIFSATTGELVDRVIYTLGSRSKTDAVPRVPGLILVGG